MIREQTLHYSRSFHREVSYSIYRYEIWRKSCNFAGEMKRSVCLDIIRGGAALLIVFFHFTWAYNNNPAHAAGVYHADWGWSVPFGYAAVVTFFMLSGYLAARYVFAGGRRGGASPKRFIVKKLKRFYPTFWVCMTFTAVVLTLWYTEERVSLLQWAANLTMVSRLFGVPFVDGAYWTMQCELIFVVIAAGLSLVTEPRRIYRILLAWIIISLAVQLCGFPKFLRWALITNHSQDFIAGMVIYRLRRERITWLTGVILLLCPVNAATLDGPFGSSIFFFVVSAILIYTAELLDRYISGNNIVIRVFSWIAAVSYPLYLIHEMVGFTVIRQMRAHGLTHPATILIPIAIVLAIAALVHYQVERRIK